MDRFEVRPGQKWHVKNKYGIDVYIEITDLCVGDIRGELRPIFRFIYTYGEQSSKEEFGFMGLCEQLQDGWTLYPQPQEQSEPESK